MAERATAIGVSPNGKARTVAETDKADLVTQDLLIEVTQQLEKQHWMWQAQRA